MHVVPAEACCHRATEPLRITGNGGFPTPAPAAAGRILFLQCGIEMTHCASLMWHAVHISTADNILGTLQNCDCALLEG